MFLGPDQQYLVKDLKLHEKYLFRICCKFDGCSDWSPWSIPQVGSTKISPYSWKENINYLLHDDNKIAKPLNDNPGVLYSNGAQVKEGFSIEFTVRFANISWIKLILFMNQFLEVDENCDDTFMGLVRDNSFDKAHILNANADSLLVKSTGDIYLNSSLKSTKLPKITSGTKVYCRKTYFVKKAKWQIFRYILHMNQQVKIKLESTSIQKIKELLMIGPLRQVTTIIICSLSQYLNHRNGRLW